MRVCLVELQPQFHIFMSSDHFLANNLCNISSINCHTQYSIDQPDEQKGQIEDVRQAVVDFPEKKRMLFVFCFRRSLRLLVIGDRIIACTLAELPCLCHLTSVTHQVRLEPRFLGYF